MAKAAVATSSRPFWWGGTSSLVGACLFILSTLLNLAYLSGKAFVQKSPFAEQNATANQTMPFDSWRELDPTFLRKVWEYRSLAAGVAIASRFLWTIAFFCLLASVYALSAAFDNHGGRTTHKASRTLLIPAFAGAAALALVDLTFSAGANTASQWIWQDWLLNDANLLSLELCYILTQSRETWILAMLWFFFGTGMTTAAYQNARHKMLKQGFNYLSLAIAILCLAGFCSDVSRLKNWVTATQVDLALAVLVSLLALPLWMLWLGVFLVSQTDYVPASASAQAPPDGARSGHRGGDDGFDAILAPVDAATGQPAAARAAVYREEQLEEVEISRL